MSLSKIPVEVVEDHIFKYLSWNDLLRLRRVSKDCLTLVQDYFNTEKGTQRAPEISVGGYSDLKIFTEMNIPTTKIYFRGICQMSQQQAEDIQSFVRKYGEKVKHLRLSHLYTHSLGAVTTQLLLGLRNLESLTVDQLYVNPAPKAGLLLPRHVLRNLKTLDLHVGMRRTLFNRDMHESLTSWLREATSLQKLRLSKDYHRDSVSLIMGPFLEALIVAVDTGDQWTSIEFDVHSTFIEDLTVNVFQRLLDTCAAKNVGVAGVHAAWLPPENLGPLRSSPITGLRIAEDAPNLGHLKLDKLTTLEITSVNAFMETEVEPSWWSATLQTLILSLWGWDVDVGLVFRQLSGGQPLIALQKASLDCREGPQCLEQLVRMAPNLKELTLIEWDERSGVLSRLLPRIQGLEKLSLMDCRRLETEAFVGHNPREPALLKVTSLRRLSVKNRCYAATGLTANCFTTVFRHMNLTHFEICAEEFTLEFQERCNWMKLLLEEGRFAESIEEIKWNGCRLHQVQDPELREIGKAFRSYNML